MRILSRLPALVLGTMHVSVQSAETTARSAFFSSFSSSSSPASSSSSSASDSSLPAIEIRAYKFFDSDTGQEFVVKGIDYYPRPNKGFLNANSMDLFTEEHRHIWERDIPFLQELGVNAVRLYAVDATKNHDGFMCALEKAGIYVIVALAHDCPTCAVTRDASPDCYPPELKTQGQAVINAFAKYSNTLAFSAGNEVNHFAPINRAQWNAPCQKKFLRDMRAYMDSCPQLRNVPVGLVSADTERKDMATYYNCRTNPDDEYETAEWYGLNSYVFCDGNATSFDDALGFQLLEEAFESYRYSIPVLLTEFGCLSDTFSTVKGFEGQRNFLQAKWLLEEPSMRNVFGGGFAFEYSIEMEVAKSDSPYPFEKLGGQSYGIGHFANETCDDITQPCSYIPHPSFYNLKGVYESAMISDLATINTFEPSPERLESSTCPAQYPKLDDFEWLADQTDDLACPKTEPFTCPIHHETILNTTGETRTGTNLLWIALAIALTAVVTILAILVFRQHRQILPLYLLTRKSSEDESTSDESNGLLSMKDYTDQSGVGKYQAISPESSSEDLLAKPGL